MENLEVYMVFKMQFYKHNLLPKVSKTGGILGADIIKLFKSVTLALVLLRINNKI